MLDKGGIPRYRWDQLLVLAWRTYLPLVLAGVFFITLVMLATLNLSSDIELLLSIILSQKPFKQRKILNISKRTMMSSRSLPVARAAYHCLNALTNEHVLKKVRREDHKPFCENLVNLTLDDTLGITQHKAAIMKHILNQKFPGSYFYDMIIKITGHSKIKYTNSNIDVRVLNEMPVLNSFINEFNSQIIDVTVTLDTLPGMFHAQKQKNMDFWVAVKSSVDSLTKPMIIRPHDEKSGTGMFQHSSRGTLGVLTFDQENTNHSIQFMTKKVSMSNLIEHDKENLAGIINGLKHDDVYKHRQHNRYYTRALEILNDNDASFNQQINSHKNYQSYLWDVFHSDPNYKRSISFILPTIIAFPSENNENFEKFRLEFQSRLEDKLYDLDKQSDFFAITFAMILAYRNNINKDIVKDLRYLHERVNIQFNKTFLDHLAIILKEGLE